MIQPADRLSLVSEYYFSRKLKEVAQLNAEGKDIISLAIGSPDMPPSEQNIEKLQRPVKQEVPEVVMICDSILGVAMDFYAIHGLKAAIEFEEPDTADTSVYLYCRSADHKADGNYIGSLVVDGEERQSDTHRLGYMAMLGGNSYHQ